jgi:hypothetical protein
VGAQTGTQQIKPPTVKQRKFAAGIAAGMPKAKAWDIAYDSNAKPSTKHVAAKRASQKPAVRAEVERLLKQDVVLQSFPDADNLAALRAQGIRTMVRLAQSEDELVAMQAANWLVTHSEKVAQFTAPGDHPRAELFSDLGKLYRKALAAAPQVVNTTLESETPPAAAQSSTQPREQPTELEPLVETVENPPAADSGLLEN